MELATFVMESDMELGYDQLKDKQVEAAVSVLSGRDTFVSLPTGYGKSVIYALLPRAFDKYRGRVRSKLSSSLMMFIKAFRMQGINRH